MDNDISSFRELAIVSIRQYRTVLDGCSGLWRDIHVIFRLVGAIEIIITKIIVIIIIKAAVLGH